MLEPKYEKKLETLDDLINSDVVYGNTDIFTSFLSIKYFKYRLHKSFEEDCRDVRKCFERMITKRDIAFIFDPFLGIYSARQLGYTDVDELVCSLDESFKTSYFTIHMKKGYPLLDRFNVIMRRYLEAGLQEMLWAELQHRASLRGRERFSEAVGEKFFPFSVSHLKPAFVVLLVGTLLSFVVFIGELTVNCLCERGERKISLVRRMGALN
jgi:hypothetical protein